MKKRLISLVLALALSAGLAVPAAAADTDETTVKIPVDAVSYEGHSYLAYTNKKSWSDAEAYCESLGGHLVTITSQEEQSFLEEYLADFDKTEYMIGLHRDIDENLGTWVTGEAVSYTNWATGEPDKGIGGNQSFAAIVTQPATGTNAYGAAYIIEYCQWDDISGDHRFICEWDSSNVSSEDTGNVATDSITLLGDAYYDEGRHCYVLTEEKTNQSGAVWFDQVRCNDDFSLSFDYYTGDPDHDSYKGADGICVAFYANSEGVKYNGGDLGFKGCGGYGVEVDTYYNSANSDPTYNHIAIVHETVSNHLVVADATDYSEDYQWHHMQITMRDKVCTVYVDGTQVLQLEDVEPTGNYQIGISGATGGGTNWHMVRNIVLSEAVWTEASKWATPELEQAQELGLIPDMLYDTDMTEPITRLEFAAVSVKVYESLSGVSAIPAIVNPFTDCADVEMLKAYNVGITNGTSTTTFEPDKLLNREQAATMLTRVFKRCTIPGWTLATDSSYPLSYTMPTPFSDDAKISKYAKDSVYFMAANGIINGMGNNLFAPKNTTSVEEANQYANATREQALAIAVRMVEKLG